MPSAIPPSFWTRPPRRAAQTERRDDVAPARLLAECLALERELARVRLERDELLSELAKRPALGPRQSGRLSQFWQRLTGTTPDPEPTPNEVHLTLEAPAADAVVPGDALTVSGWAAGTLPIVRVDVLIDEIVHASCRPTSARPDVAAAFPQFGEHTDLGFSTIVPLTDVASGSHVLRVRAVDRQGLARETARGLWVEHPDLLPTKPSCQRFALYTSSLGNYFFGEIRDLLAAGLRELGFAVDIRDERYGFSEEADWHMVVAPHEFFKLGDGPTLAREGLPPQLILVNTEQPSTVWFGFAREHFGAAQAIWDISFDSAAHLRAEGIACRYLPLGYALTFDEQFPVADLPAHYGTSFLEPEIRAAVSATQDFEHRPIDVLFVGHLSERRERFFSDAAPVLARHRCYLHLASVDRPIIPGQTTHMSSATVAGLAKRSKIVLNLHHGRDRYFEWHRIVMHGVWHRALVLTEPCGSAPPFRPGVDFIEVPLDEIPAEIDRLLTTAAGRADARRTIHHAYATLTERCRLTDSLREAIIGLYANPALPNRFAGGGNASVAFELDSTDAAATAEGPHATTVAAGSSKPQASPPPIAYE